LQFKQFTDIPNLINLAIFASGTGTNAEKLLAYFEHHAAINIALVVTNNAEAGVVSIAKKYCKEVFLINKKQLFDEGFILVNFKKKRIDFIVLAGFLLKIPEYLIASYPQRIINIHPALLPNYGGRGMYGMHVHKAVVANAEKQTGISIHWVNEHYDEGEILFQTSCDITAEDSPETVAQKVHELEHKHFAPVVEKAVLNTPI